MTDDQTSLSPQPPLASPEGAALFNDLARGPDGGQAVRVTTTDGVGLRLGLWPADPRVSERGTIFLMPGRTEYIEKYGLAARDLTARGYCVYVIDWRGQGLSDRLHQDPRLGHLLRFADFQHDLDAMLALATQRDLPRPWFTLAHSMAGAIALRRLMGRHPFTACAFSAPMWGLTLPRWLNRFAGPLAHLVRNSKVAAQYTPGSGPGTYVEKTAFDGNMLTHDPAMWDYLREQMHTEPTLAIGGPSYQWAAESIIECQSLAALSSPDLPCVTALGSEEKIVSPGAIQSRMAHWGRGKLLTVTGGGHEVMMETPGRRRMFFDAVERVFVAAAGAQSTR